MRVGEVPETVAGLGGGRNAGRLRAYLAREGGSAGLGRPAIFPKQPKLAGAPLKPSLRHPIDGLRVGEPLAR